MTSSERADPECPQALRLDADLVPDGDGGEVGSESLASFPGGGAWAGRSVAPPQNIGGDDEVLFGIEGPAGTQESFPPVIHVG